MEMKGHDEAIQTILKMGKGELNISESRIRNLHKEIMYEESPTEKTKLGEWKKQPNHVINYRDEKFNFSDPSEVADSMHELVNWINAEKERIEAKKKDALHPVELGFEFPLRYLTIHPFYDGNGRTGRILTNLILISYGYPPIYIKDNEKQFYYRYLADVQGYGTDKYDLFDLMSDYLIRSLKIVTDAIAGKSIEEPEDLDKKIQLLERELSASAQEIDAKTRFSKDVFLKIYDDWLSKLITSAIQVIEKFKKLFSSNSHFVNILHAKIAVELGNDTIAVILKELKKQIINSEQLDRSPHELGIATLYENLFNNSLESTGRFMVSGSIKIKFGETKYQVFVDIFDEKINHAIPTKIFERLLDEPLSDEEIASITSDFGDSIFNYIDYNTKKYRLRK